MAELTLEPYAIVQQWTIRQPGLPPETILKDYLEGLAVGCAAAGGGVIGHIKALALFPERQYLRVSVTAAHLPATLEGAAPPGCQSLQVTLNILVYGLSRSQLETLTRAAGDELRQKWPVDIS